MARHVDAYECEWKETLERPERLLRFVAFVNSDEPDPTITQVRSGASASRRRWAARVTLVGRQWCSRRRAGRRVHLDRLTPDRGVAALVDGQQVAVFLLAHRRALRRRQPSTRLGRQRAQPRPRRRHRRRADRRLAGLQAALRPAHRRVPRRRRRRGSTCTARCGGIVDGDDPHARSPDDDRSPFRRRTVAPSGADEPGPERAPPGLLPLDAGEQYRFGFSMDACIGCHSLRGRLRRAERPARRAPAGGGSARSRAASTPTTPALPPLDVVQPLPRAGVPRRLPDRRLREARQRRRRPPRRRLHRLPVLHLGLPLQRPGVPARPAHRHQVRHVPAPPRGGPAPACVGACPTHAITVERVDVEAWRADHAAGRRPAAAAAGLTLSTTRIALPSDVPVETFAASDWNLRPEHPHWPLVWLTLVSQVAVGVSAHRRPTPADRVARRRASPPPAWPARCSTSAGRRWPGRRSAACAVVAEPRGRAARRLRRAGRSRPCRCPRSRSPRPPSASPASTPRPACTSSPVARRGTRRSRSVRFLATAPATGPLLTGRPASPSSASSLALGADGANWARPRPGPGQPWRGSVRLELGWFRSLDRVLRCASALVGVAVVALAVARSRRRAGRARRRRAHRPLALLRHRRPAQHARLVLARARAGTATGEPRSSTGQATLLGVDHGGDRYTYVDDPGRRTGRARAARRRAVGAHHVRLLLGRAAGCCSASATARPSPSPGTPTTRSTAAASARRASRSTTRIAAPGRLTTPLSTAAPASWDAALDRDGRRVPRDRRARTAPKSIAVLSTGQLVTEEFYALGKLVRLGMGVRHYDGNTTLCMASAVSGYKLQLRHRRPARLLRGPRARPTSSCCGAPTSPTTTRCSRPACSMDRDRDASSSSIPRVTKTAMVADVHLAVRPRGDIALLNGILRVLLDEGLVDLDAVRGRVDGLDDLLAHLEAWTVERAAAESGIDAGQLRAAGPDDRPRRALRARLDDGREPLGAGHRDRHPAQHARRAHRQHRPARRRRRSRSPASATPWAPGRPASPRRCPATAPTTTPRHRGRARRAARHRRGPPADRARPRLPRHRQRRHVRTHQGPVGHRHQPGRVVPEPRGARARPSLASTCSSCRTASRRPPPRSPTSCSPPPSGARRTGTFTNSERRVSRVRAAVAPPGEARTDFDIVLAVAERWGCADELFAGWTGPRGRLRGVAPGLGRHGRATTAASPGSASTRPAACSGRARPTTRRAARRHAAAVHRRALQPPGGRAAVRAVEPEPIRDRPRPEFPLLLNTGRTVEHWHTRTKTGPRRRSSRRSPPRRGSRCTPTTPTALGVRSGDFVRVTSSRGERRAHPRPGHADRARRRGVHPVPLGRALRQPADRRPVRPDLPRAELQAVRRAGRAPACVIPAAP